MDNAPQPKIPPTDINLLRYVAFFPNYQLDNGNGQWFHNLMLFVTGGVSESIQKVLKNHAAIHNACGFMLTHTDIGLGYGFGLFPNAMLHVSSAGAARSSVTHWLL